MQQTQPETHGMKALHWLPHNNLRATLRSNIVLSLRPLHCHKGNDVIRKKEKNTNQRSVRNVFERNKSAAHFVPSMGGSGGGS